MSNWQLIQSGSNTGGATGGTLNVNASVASLPQVGDLIVASYWYYAAAGSNTSTNAMVTNTGNAFTSLTGNSSVGGSLRYRIADASDAAGLTSINASLVINSGTMTMIVQYSIYRFPFAVAANYGFGLRAASAISGTSTSHSSSAAMTQTGSTGTFNEDTLVVYNIGFKANPGAFTGTNTFAAQSITTNMTNALANTYCMINYATGVVTGGTAAGQNTRTARWTNSVAYNITAITFYYRRYNNNFFNK